MTAIVRKHKTKMKLVLSKLKLILDDAPEGGIHGRVGTTRNSSLDMARLAFMNGIDFITFLEDVGRDSLGRRVVAGLHMGLVDAPIRLCEHHLVNDQRSGPHV